MTRRPCSQSAWTAGVDWLRSAILTRFFTCCFCSSLKASSLASGSSSGLFWCVGSASSASMFVSRPSLSAGGSLALAGCCLEFIGGDLEWETAVFTEFICQFDDAFVARVVVPVNADRAPVLMRFFEQVKDTPFLMGKNDRKWRADLDFLMTESKFISIIEGKYDRREAA